MFIHQKAYAHIFQKLCRGGRSGERLFRGFTTARRFRLPDNDGPPDDGTINFFEQDVVPRSDGKGFTPVGQPQNLQKKIRELENQLKQLKAHVPKELLEVGGEDILESLELDRTEIGVAKDRFSAADFAELLRSEHEAEIGPRRITRSQERSQVALRLPETQAKNLKRLNKMLRLAESHYRGVETARLLWRSYTAAKEAVPGLLQQLPDGAWRVLWESQYSDAIINDARSKHLWVLVNDMVHTGYPLMPVQRMVQIEACFAAEQHSQALELWYAAQGDLGGHPEVSDNFWTLGARLFLKLGEVDHAMSLAIEVAEKHPSASVTCLVPVLETYLAGESEAEIQQAAAAYFRIRIALGDRISLKDFDLLIKCFLESRQPELAIGVFKDMLLSQGGRDHINSASHGSNHLFDLFQSQAGTDAEHANQISLNILNHLPRRFQNKFFYASWLKRLIGLNDLESALRVLELMYHRGIRPDAKHLNGLMSAWLRRGTLQARELALELGKAMVQARLDFVAARHATHQGEPPAPGPIDPSTLLPPYLGRALPAATIETFSILLLHYESSNMPTSMVQLQNTLDLAELSPNIFFVNHILHGHLRSGDVASGWKLYCKVVHNGLQPDMYTFAILWDICRHHVESHAPGMAQKFPSPRALFGYMSSWFGGLRKKDAAAARDSMKSETYVQIIRCLYLARDTRGTLVALYALRDMFNLYPDERATRLVAMLVARAGERVTTQRIWRNDGTRNRKRQSVKIRDQASQANFEQVLRLLDTLKDERKAELQLQGMSLEELSGQQKGEEALWLLVRFLKDCLDYQEQNLAESRGADKSVGVDEASDQVQDPALERFKAHLEEVAFEMGAGGITISPPVYQLDETP